MGGSVSICIKENQKITNIDAHTGNLYLLRNPDNLKNSKALLSNFSEQQQIQDTFYPFEYGLVVVDYDNQIICSYQGYTELFTFLSTELSMSMRGQIYSDNKEELPHYMFKKCLNDGLISGVQIFNHSKKKEEFIPLKDFLSSIPNAKTDYETIEYDLLKSHDFSNFIFQPKGWKLINYEKQENETMGMTIIHSYKKIFNDLIKQGFPINIMKNSCSAWQEWMDELFEQLLEDEEISERQRDEFNLQKIIAQITKNKIENHINNNVDLINKTNNTQKIKRKI